MARNFTASLGQGMPLTVQLFQFNCGGKFIGAILANLFHFRRKFHFGFGRILQCHVRWSSIKWMGYRINEMSELNWNGDICSLKNLKKWFMWHARKMFISRGFTRTNDPFITCYFNALYPFTGEHFLTQCHLSLKLSTLSLLPGDDRINFNFF